MALTFLQKNGYRILETNFRHKSGEIDIIAKDKGILCFVEVKTRRSLDFGLPQESITAAKQKQIAKAALFYLSRNNLLEANARFDVVSVLYEGAGRKIELIKDAFDFSLSDYV